MDKLGDNLADNLLLKIKEVYEDDNFIGILDANPKAPGHTLIIPKKHIASTQDFNENNIHYLSEMAILANKIAEEEGINNNGYRWVINTGEDGGQTVGHIHLHVIGGRQMHWPPG